MKIYGGVGREQQIRDLNWGADILIATPGRLIDFVKSGNITLLQVKYFVIDEADRIMDMGFEPQLNEIAFNTNITNKENRLNLFFSATFTPEIRDVARKFMNEYYFITKNRCDENEANKNIIQVLLKAEEEEKIMKLHGILQNVEGSILSI